MSLWPSAASSPFTESASLLVLSAKTSADLYPVLPFRNVRTVGSMPLLLPCSPLPCSLQTQHDEILTSGMGELTHARDENSEKQEGSLIPMT